MLDSPHFGQTHSARQQIVDQAHLLLAHVGEVIPIFQVREIRLNSKPFIFVRAMAFFGQIRKADGEKAKGKESLAPSLPPGLVADPERFSHIHLSNGLRDAPLVAFSNS